MERRLLAWRKPHEFPRPLVQDETERAGQLHGAAAPKIHLSGIVSKPDNAALHVTRAEATYWAAP